MSENLSPDLLEKAKLVAGVGDQEAAKLWQLPFALQIDAERATQTTRLEQLITEHAAQFEQDRRLRKEISNYFFTTLVVDLLKQKGWAKFLDLKQKSTQIKKDNSVTIKNGLTTLERVSGLQGAFSMIDEDDTNTAQEEIHEQASRIQMIAAGIMLKEKFGYDGLDVHGLSRILVRETANFEVSEKMPLDEDREVQLKIFKQILAELISYTTAQSVSTDISGQEKTQKFKITKEHYEKALQIHDTIVQKIKNQLLYKPEYTQNNFIWDSFENNLRAFIDLDNPLRLIVAGINRINNGEFFDAGHN